MCGSYVASVGMCVCVCHTLVFVTVICESDHLESESMHLKSKYS